MRAADPRQLFTERHETYARFMRAMRYPQGLRSFFLSSALVHSGIRVLDAGCGTGALTLAVHAAFVRRGCAPDAIHAFDLTAAMLDQLREALRRQGIEDVELAEANALHLEALPPAWRDYDLIVSASMLEYVPRDRFVEALAGVLADCLPPLSNGRTVPGALGPCRRSTTLSGADVSCNRWPRAPARPHPPSQDLAYEHWHAAHAATIGVLPARGGDGHSARGGSGPGAGD